MATLFFGYVDWTSAGEPFYVGIGNEGRVRSIKRNNKHTHVANKHGLERSVEFESNDWSEMCAWEIATVLRLRTHHLESDTDMGCNFTFGGDGKQGYVPGPEARARMSASARRRSTPEANARIAAKLRGREVPVEQREKISAGLTGKKRQPFSEEWKRNIANATREGMARALAEGTWKPRRNQRPVTEETRKKLSAAKKGKPHSPEHREAIRAAHLRRHHGNS